MHFEIPVDDMERAQKFYNGLFGWEIASAGPTFQDYFIIKTGGDGINGGMMKRSNPGQQPINYISVESVDESVKKVEELGGKVLMPKMPVMGMGWNAVCQDTENNGFGLWQEDKNAA